MLIDKTALVTGASGGIGQAIALRLAQSGAKVAVHYSGNRESALDTVRVIEKNGGRAFAVKADLRDIVQIEALTAEVANEQGEAIDILINNAGIGLSGNIRDTSVTDFDNVFATNTKGTFFVTKAALPHIPDGGVIINVSSMVSLAAYPNCIAYAMSKAALNSFTRSLAANLGERNIRVNAVAPGATATNFIAHVMENTEYVTALENLTALKRIGEPNDIADVVAFLVSPDAAWITGQLIEVSGGMHL